MVASIKSLALTGAVLPASALAASNLIASHFTGNLYPLTLSDSDELTVGSAVSSNNFWPDWLDYDSESGTLYVADGANWAPPNGMTVFSVGSDGSISPGNAEAQHVTEGGEVHSHRYGGGDGNGFVALAHYGGSKVVTYELPLTSSSQPVATLDYSGVPTGPHPRQDASHPHAAQPDPSGSYLLVPDLGTDLINIYAIDQDSGELTECPAAQANPGDGPRHVAFWSPSDANDSDVAVVLSVNELSNSVTYWTAAESDGCLALTEVETLSSLTGGAEPSGDTKAAEVRVRDNFVYVSNRFDMSFGDEEDSLAMFELSLADGAPVLEFVELVNGHGWFPRTFDINAAGDLVAVGGQTSSNVAILERNPADGRIGGVVANVEVGQRGNAGDEDGLSAVIWIE